VTRAALPHRGTGKSGREHGSVSVYLVIFAFAAFALLALLVDGGSLINAKERAADIAEQAARAASNQIDVAALRSANPTVVIGPGACSAAGSVVAQYHLTDHQMAAEMTNCIAVPGTTVATVGVTMTTQLVLPLPFFHGITMTSTATARPVCGITQGGQC
jgi:Flp pilus assembly protein TadG